MFGIVNPVLASGVTAITSATVSRAAEADFRVNRKLHFAAVTLLAIAVRLICFTGLIASDDLGYSSFAQAIAAQRFELTPHHFALRFGLNIPVALAYRIFEISEWSTIVVPFVASILSVVLLMAIGRKLFGPDTALIAGILLATFPVEVRYATMLVPEPVAQCYILLGILAYICAQERNSLILGTAAGLWLGIAYLTKEPSALVVPAAIIDAAASRRWRLLSTVALGALLLVAAEHAYYVRATGDLLFRPHALANHNQTAMVVSANSNLVYRLVKAYPRIMLVPNLDMGLHSLFALIVAAPAVLLFRLKKVWLLLLWPLMPFLYLNFGTTGFQHFVALPVSPRYIGFLYAPIFLIAGTMVTRYMLTSRFRRVMSLLTITAVAAIGIVCAFETRAQGYFTDDVRGLRTIVKKARSAHMTGLEIEGERRDRWERTVAILDRNLHHNCSPGPNVLQVKPDAYGLPAAPVMPQAPPSTTQRISSDWQREH